MIELSVSFKEINLFMAAKNLCVPSGTYGFIQREVKRTEFIQGKGWDTFEVKCNNINHFTRSFGCVDYCFL